MKPFYFGSPEKSLFGIYHPPLTGHHPGHGVVLCHPLGHEYIYGHRAFRQLAIHLARAGFAVLRFDYYGCGDSAGASEEGSIHQWIDDIETALKELKECNKMSKLYLIGARIGATLAALVGDQRSDINGLALWDPVLNGTNYVRELLAQHEDWLRQAWVETAAPKKNDRHPEALGFPLTHPLQDSLEQINLLSMPLRSTGPVLVVESGEASAALGLSNHFTGADGCVEYRHSAAPQVWSRKRGGDNALVPSEVLQSITAWMSRIAK
ncbi:MAG: alpha/beta fold hydrolase [Candidatus Binatia bacterium]